MSAKLEHLERLKEVTNEILALAQEKKEEIDGAINWADLRCQTAAYVMNDAGEEWFEVIISEADPIQVKLREFVKKELEARGFYITFPVFEW